MVPFTISEESVIHLKELLAREANVRPGQGIRIYISGLSGYGPEWSLTLDDYSQDTDECCEFDELKVIVERDLLNSVGGLDVQYEAMEEGGGFLITALDPELRELFGGGGCGCGCGSCHGCHGENGCSGCHSCESCDGCSNWDDEE